MRSHEIFAPGATLALLALLTTGLPVLASVPAKPAPDEKLVMATVNGDEITSGDLVRIFSTRHSGHSGFLGGETEARSFLNLVIDDKLLEQEALNLGLDEEASVKAVVGEYADKILGDALVQAEITDKAKPSPADLEAARRQLGVIVQARQIALATRAEAEEVRAAILRGEDAEALARLCSGARSNRNSGNIMTGWGKFSPSWETAVFALEPGDVSPVIETDDGFEVIQVINRVEVDLPELAAVSEQLKTTVESRKTDELKAALGVELWARFHAVLAPVDLSPEGLVKAWFKDPAMVLASWDGGKVTLADCFNEQELWQILSLPPVRARNEIDRRIRATVNAPLATNLARARGMEKQPDVASKIEQYRQFVMMNLLYRDHIFRDIKLGDTELRAFYDRNAALFEEPRQLHVAQILVGSRKEAEEIRAKLAAGEDFSALATKLSKDPVSASVGGDLGWITPDRVPAGFEELLRLPVGGVTQPLPMPNGAWHLVKVVELKDKRMAAFDEVKEKVRQRALDAAKREARNDWISKLRSASKIEIHEPAVKQFVADHKDDGAQPPPQHAIQ